MGNDIGFDFVYKLIDLCLVLLFGQISKLKTANMGETNQENRKQKTIICLKKKRSQTVRKVTLYYLKL